MRSFPLLLCLFIGLVTATSAVGQVPSVQPRMPCHDYHKIAESLGKRYGEMPVSLGLQTNGHLLQVFSSPKSGSWTILSVAPSGTGCIVAAGERWQTQLRSSMTPFRATEPEEPVFDTSIRHFFDGHSDDRALTYLGQHVD